MQPDKPIDRLELLPLPQDATLDRVAPWAVSNGFLLGYSSARNDPDLAERIALYFLLGDSDPLCPIDEMRPYIDRALGRPLTDREIALYTICGYVPPELPRETA